MSHRSRRRSLNPAADFLTVKENYRARAEAKKLRDVSAAYWSEAVQELRAILPVLAPDAVYYPSETLLDFRTVIRAVGL